LVCGEDVVVGDTIVDALADGVDVAGTPDAPTAAATPPTIIPLRATPIATARNHAILPSGAPALCPCGNTLFSSTTPPSCRRLMSPSPGQCLE
jgi:hypothetical protein